jgi:predicted transcriptional regulator
VDKDAPVKYLVVRDSKDNQDGQNIRLYKVTVTENELVKRIVESWNTSTFDDLAFSIQGVMK